MLHNLYQTQGRRLMWLATNGLRKLILEFRRVLLAALEELASAKILSAKQGFNLACQHSSAWELYTRNWGRKQDLNSCQEN